jgi:hypothetical protein
MPLGANKVALLGASADTGTSILLATGIASSSASLEFTIPATYKQIVFGFYNIAPATDNVHFGFQGTTDGTNYNLYMTTTAFEAYNNEVGGSPDVNYQTAIDQAQGQIFQPILPYMGNDADQSGAGALHLFNPSSTTYVKHFFHRGQVYNATNYAQDDYMAGYFNTTSAITAIKFQMASGNIGAGTIKMWGVL